MEGDRYYQLVFSQLPGDTRYMPGVIRIVVGRNETLIQKVKKIARDERILVTKIIRESDGLSIKVDGNVFRR